MEEGDTGSANQMRVGRARAGKVPLKPGRSQLDWLRDKRKIKQPALRVIGLDELSKHNKKGDVWMAVRGVVYNATPYVEYHPGGEAQIMRGAGKDATALFDSYHAWVNIDFMLDTCVIGRLAQ